MRMRVGSGNRAPAFEYTLSKTGTILMIMKMTMRVATVRITAG